MLMTSAERYLNLLRLLSTKLTTFTSLGIALRYAQGSTEISQLLTFLERKYRRDSIDFPFFIFKDEIFFDVAKPRGSNCTRVKSYQVIKL